MTTHDEGGPMSDEEIGNIMVRAMPCWKHKPDDPQVWRCPDCRVKGARALLAREGERLIENAVKRTTWNHGTKRFVAVDTIRRMFGVPR